MRKRFWVLFLLFVLTAGCHSEIDVSVPSDDNPSDTLDSKDSSTDGDIDVVPDIPSPDGQDQDIDATDGDGEKETDVRETDTSPPDTCEWVTDGEVAEQFVSNLYQTTCSRIFNNNCGGTQYSLRFLQFSGVADESACRRVLTRRFGSPAQFRQLVEAEDIEIHNCRVEQCVEKTGSRSCAGLFRFVKSDGIESLQTCGEAIRGQKSQGDDCIFSAECDTGLTCDSESGDTCTSTCVESSGDGSVNGQCGRNRCSADQYCADVGGGNKVCQDKKEAGEDCGNSTECVSGLCQSTCQEIELVGEGESCNTTSRLCNPGLLCSDGTCRPFAGDGDECPIGFECSAPFNCNDSSTCTPAKSQGASCDSNSECNSGRCNDGTCLGIDQLCPE